MGTVPITRDSKMPTRSQTRANNSVLGNELSESVLGDMLNKPKTRSKRNYNQVSPVAEVKHGAPSKKRKTTRNFKKANTTDDKEMMAAVEKNDSDKVKPETKKKVTVKREPKQAKENELVDDDDTGAFKKQIKKLVKKEYGSVDDDSGAVKQKKRSEKSVKKESDKVDDDNSGAVEPKNQSEKPAKKENEIVDDNDYGAVKPKKQSEKSVKNENEIVDHDNSGAVKSKKQSKKPVKKSIKSSMLTKKWNNQEIPINLKKLRVHPKFVASRHVKRYEIIWPTDTAPITQIEIDENNVEDVYLRKNVRTLHTRGTWIQKARMVREGEVPAKKIANWMQNKKQNKAKDYKGSELFGKWQVDHFQPPVAVNRKVPRNAYGNCDLHHACMLPLGTTWITDLNNGVFSRVCRTLEVDAAKAVIGFHPSRRYPLTDGYVICKEFEKQVMEAYYEKCGYDDEHKKEERKMRTRKLWHKAYRGVLIQKKLERMYEGEQIDPAIERIMMSELNYEPNRSSTTSTRKATSSKKSSRKGNARVKVEAESDEEDEEEEPVKPTAAIQRRAALPRRQAAQKVAKFDFSSDSSDFENSEDDFSVSD